jgi:hypothetical protein
MPNLQLHPTQHFICILFFDVLNFIKTGKTEKEMQTYPSNVRLNGD